MINILIVDDIEIKLNKVAGVLTDIADIPARCIDKCDCEIAAKELLSKKFYDLVILDIQLPLRSNDTPRKDAGLKFLKRLLSSDKYLTPAHILGLTAYDENIDEIRREFGEEVCSLVKYDPSSTSWSRKIVDLAKRIIQSKVASHALGGGNNHIVITIHGIRTFGEWQNNFKGLLKKHYKDIDVIQYSYGFLSIFTYLIPPLRLLAYKRFNKFINEIAESNPNAHVDIIAHSFGTKIVSHSIKSIKQELIHTIILSGSVLGHNYPWNKYINDKRVKRVVNDCGTRDLALILNSHFVLFSGMAGLLGFSGGLSENLTNRYFAGGHDFCFRENGVASSTFMEKNWVPLILSSHEVNANDDRASIPIVSDFLSFYFSFSWVVKIAIYWLAISLIL